MFNPFDTNAHVWRPIFNPFNFLHDVYASEDVDFGSSYDLIGKNKNHPEISLLESDWASETPNIIWITAEWGLDCA